MPYASRLAHRVVRTVLLGGVAALTWAASASAADPGLASAYLAGRHAEAAADTPRALKYLSRAVELDPNNQSILQSAYFLALQAGAFTSAVPEARRAYEGSPNRGMAALIVAADYMKRGDYENAQAIIDKIPTQNVAGFALPMIRTWVSAPSQPFEKAIAHLQGLKNVRESATIIDLITAQLNEFYGRSAEALARYDAITERAASENIGSIIMTAEGYDRLGKTSQAKAILQKFLAAHPGVVSPTIDGYMEAVGRNAFGKVTPQVGFANALYAAADLLIASNTNDFGAQVGIAFAQAALYVNPELTMARRFIGTTLAARERIPEANAMLNSVRRGSPQYLESQMQIAENMARSNKSPEATVILRNVLKDRPNWVDAHLAIADIARRDKNYGEAITAYDAALKLTSDANPNAWMIYYTRGMSLERNKNWDAAERDFRKALQLKPDEPSVLNYLGYSYLDRGENMKEGRKLIEQAYNKRPDDGYIIDSMGWAYFITGEYEKAVVTLEKAVESTPGDATINEHLGDAYWKVGRRAEARFQWERALVMGPEDSQRALISTKIEKGLPQK
jgi:tetratricopeptide (TPR) repeat protein